MSSLTAFLTKYSAIIIFYIVIVALLIWKRKKLDFQAKVIVLYRMKWGLKWMDKYATKYREWVILLGYVGVGVGFIGMLLIGFLLIKNVIDLFIVPNAAAGVALVIPGVNVPGLGVLPFWYWIIAIFIIAMVHEFSHGIVARAHNVEVKNTGIVLFGPIIGAFVEPNEETIHKKKDITQYSILAAGAFSNIILALVALLLVSFVFTPIQSNMVTTTGFTFDEFISPDLPFAQAGIAPGTLITGINGEKTMDFQEFAQELQTLKPGEKVTIETPQKDHIITLAQNPDNNKRPYLGIQNIHNEVAVNARYQSGLGKVGYEVVNWITGFMRWLFLLSFGIGLFNLLPLPIVDGGRMAQVFLQRLKGKEKGNWYYGKVGMFFLLVLILSFALPYLMKLF